MNTQLAVWQKQPEPDTLVWKHNRLAEARYQLTPREQKLLMYVIAMIEPEDDNFKRYVVNVAHFAQMAGLAKDDLYGQLRETAKRLKQKPLIIENHFDPETGKHIDLITSWFESAFIGRNGAGYFAVTLSPPLKPYLLQVKREFYRYRLYQIMQFKSSYASRLYEWVKRWQFRQKIEISVTELRRALGAEDKTLPQYADFKRRALAPAVKEVNYKSDLRVTFKELKRAGSKAVEKILVSVEVDESPQLEVVQPEPPPQFELELATAGQNNELISECMTRYGLSESQAAQLQSYYEKRGEEYIREKVTVVDQEPRENAGRAFLAALRDDWKPKVITAKPKRIQKSEAKQPESPRPSAEESKKLAQGFREFRSLLKRDPAVTS
jgi:replication initiator protein